MRLKLLLRFDANFPNSVLIGGRALEFGGSSNAVCAELLNLEQAGFSFPIEKVRTKVPSRTQVNHSFAINGVSFRGT